MFFKRTKIMKYSELYRKLKKAGVVFDFVMEADTTSGTTLPMGSSAVCSSAWNWRGAARHSQIYLSRTWALSPGSSSMRILVCEKNTFDYELITI